jgi:branched-chain amino acid transport system ATP-binding protein
VTKEARATSLRNLHLSVVGKGQSPISVSQEAKTSILLVEQNARMALEVGHRAYVFEIGRIALSGNRGELLEDERIKKAYLGS